MMTPLCVSTVNLNVINGDTASLLWLAFWDFRLSQPVFTCSKLTIETLEQGVKYVKT